MSAPIIPPRPTRNHGGLTAVKQDTPQIPPRPARKVDPSPDRDITARSPLNFLPTTNGSAFKPPPPAADEAPRRPPSVALPSMVGQEGMEYSSYDQLPPEAHGVTDSATSAAAAAPETKNVSADVPLHQPRASVPQSTAKSRISTVTRTDSTQAAAAGIGRAQPDDDVHKGPIDASMPLSRVTSKTHDDNLRRVPSAEPHPLRKQTSFSRSTSSLQNGTPRPVSIHSVEPGEHFEGIPEIGQQIPLYPNAGDVQAPSPAPTQSQFTAGIGYFNDGSGRAHHRKRSSRHEFGPPGSYGLHGHGAESQDQFEKAWLAKHPDEASKELYNPYMLRPETALSSEQLNRIVSQEDIGMGASPAAIGTPTQEIAFEASDAFTSRRSSPKASPAPLTELRKKRSSSDHQPPAESPLRKTSYPWNESKFARSGEKALESEDEDVVHVDPPARRVDKVTGGGPVDDAVDLGLKGGNTEEEGGWYVERGEGTPILASDEILKRPSSAFLQPAVDPEEAHHVDDSYYDSEDLPPSRRSSLKPPSRPSSRPGSMHGGYQGGPLHRFISHEEHHGSGMGTPLEEIEEYEPLFPEGEDDEAKAERVFKKRPGLATHHFPSQDIWEDTPNSLQYQATVQTPEPPTERIAAAEGVPATVFETPEQEEARRTQNPMDMTSDQKTFAKPHFKPGVRDELSGRPGVQRFPSQDIWEDTPSSMMFVTTVSSPQMDETKSPPEDRPTTTALPSRQDDLEARSTTGFTQVLLQRRPSVPERPQRKSKLAHEITHEKEDPREKEVPDLGTNKEQVPDHSKPTIPERPKPTVPARPARPSHSDHAEGAPLVKTVSSTSAGSGASDETVTSPPAPKVKPAVPARPAGGKIAALQSTFMNDLNNRLKLGPQVSPPKPKEPEPEVVEAPKEPLADARKGRAKGPARRKPAASPSAAAAEVLSSSFSTVTTLWQIDESDELRVANNEIAPVATGKEAIPAAEEHSVAEPAEQKSEEPFTALERALSVNEAINTQEPAMHTRLESVTESPVDTNPRDVIGAEADKPAPAISSAVAEEQAEVQPELKQSLAQAEPASTNAEEQESTEMVSSAVQTGQKNREITSPAGEKQKLTAYLGGNVREDGDVVVKESEV